MGAGSISVDVMTPDQERAAIVAWLRKREREVSLYAGLSFWQRVKITWRKDLSFRQVFGTQIISRTFGFIADAIARGDYKGE